MHVNLSTVNVHVLVTFSSAEISTKLTKSNWQILRHCWEKLQRHMWCSVIMTEYRHCIWAIIRQLLPVYTLMHANTLIIPLFHSLPEVRSRWQQASMVQNVRYVSPRNSRHTLTTPADCTHWQCGSTIHTHAIQVTIRVMCAAKLSNSHITGWTAVQALC